jgi:hypothetical protein
VAGEAGIQALVAQVTAFESAEQAGREQRHREVGGLHDQRAAADQPQAAQPEHRGRAAQAGAHRLRRGDRAGGEQPGADLGALSGQVGGEAAQVTDVVGVTGGHVGAAAVPGVDQPVVDE